MRKNYKYHARPRFQRAFFAWLVESCTRIKIPFRVVKRTKKSIFLASTGSSDLKIHVSLTKKYTEIGYSWKNGQPNSLLNNPVTIERVENGFRCEENPDAEEWGDYIHNVRNIYATIEDVWRVHVFEIFLDIINSVTKYPWVELYEPLSWNDMFENPSSARRDNTNQADYLVVYGCFGEEECDLPPKIFARLINSVEDRLQPELDHGLRGTVIPNPLYIP